MCIICVEFQRSRDIADARRMLQAARIEPKSIERQHLDEVEHMLEEEEKKAQSKGQPQTP